MYSLSLTHGHPQARTTACTYIKHAHTNGFTGTHTHNADTPMHIYTHTQNTHAHIQTHMHAYTHAHKMRTHKDTYSRICIHARTRIM